MFEKIRKKAAGSRGVLIIVLSAAIMLIYLYCDGFYNLGREDDMYKNIGECFKALLVGAPYYFRPVIVNSLTILFGYLAWKSYKKETSPVGIAILFMGIAVILPFGEGIYRLKDWIDAGEKLFEFALVLWPVPAVCLGSFGMRKLSKRGKFICSVSMAVVFLLMVGLQLFIEKIEGENWYHDLWMPAIWLTESVLWLVVLNGSKQGTHRKRNIMTAWVICLLLFGCFTFTEVSYLRLSSIWGFIRGNYWNRVVFFCWPVFLMIGIKALYTHSTNDKPYAVWKISLLYFFVVLLVIYFTTNLALNYGIGSFQYDISHIFYLMFLADIVIWNELYRKLKRTGCRVKSLLFMIVVNVGELAFLFIKENRLQEILCYISFSFLGGSQTQVDWLGYRKAALQAFLSNDLTILDSLYRKEKYQYALFGGHGVAAIRFQFGMLPLVVMVLLLILTAAFLWNWKPDNIFICKCSRYLAAGYLLKMFCSVILQANMVLSPYIEFPFTGMDMAEMMVLVLVVREGMRSCST